jgi:hypothetical protein
MILSLSGFHIINTLTFKIGTRFEIIFIYISAF